MDSLAREVVDYLDQNNIPTAHVFGYSMGGYAALKAARKAPERIKTAVTYGTKFNWSLEATEKELKFLNPEITEIKVPQFAAKLKQEHQPLDWKKLMHHTAIMMQGLAQGQKLDAEALRSIDIPVSIGMGSEDHMVSFQESKEVSQLLGNARLKLIPEGVHSLEKNDPSTIAAIISSEISAMHKISFRDADIKDLPLLEKWDKEEHLQLADPSKENWKYELDRTAPWREQWLALLGKKAIGFIQIIDPHLEESNYWQNADKGKRAIDIWIGEKDFLNKGYGTLMMKEALKHCFEQSGVNEVLVDPLESNIDAIRFYKRLGFKSQGMRTLGNDQCEVFALSKSDWRTA